MVAHIQFQIADEHVDIVNQTTWRQLVRSWNKIGNEAPRNKKTILQEPPKVIFLYSIY